jgi:DNA-binding beta-propeller fold protein YncE
VVLNADNGKVVKELPIGDGCDGVVFDPATKTIFAANGEGTLSIIREKSATSYEVLKKLPTKNGARTLALDEKTHLVYLPTGDFAPAEHTPQESKKKRAIIPGSFQVMVVGQ